MLSRLSQGFTNVLQELSGDEPPNGAPQDMLVPQLPPGDAPGAPEESGPGVEEEPLEMLAHLEQLTVHLKEVVRDKDSQLATFETQLKSERETAEARFTKLKLQAKTKMAALNKQIADLKGQEGATSSPDSSFTSSAPAVEEELQELRKQLSEVSTSAKNLQERLQMSEQALCEKEAVHTEQVRVLQAVVCEKDVRFQEQIQKHEDELLRVTVQRQNEAELQQALRAAQRRCEEQEEAMRSRCQVLEILQGELNNADQQKQILTAQFRQMEQELAEAGRQREEERQQWAGWSSQAQAELVALRANLEASERDRAAQLANLETSERDRSTQMEELTVKLEWAAREREEVTNREVARLEKELAALREEHGEGQRAGEALAELLTGLRSLAGEGAEEDSSVPTDPALCLGTLQTLEARLKRLRVEQRESEERCTQVTHSMETLQEQLDKRTAEGEEAVARIQQLEQQIGMAARESLVQCVTDPSVEEVTDAEKAQILALEQQLLEKDHELTALRESLVLAKEQGSNDAFKVSADQILDQSEDTAMAPCDSPTVLPDLLEDTREEDTTLVAEDCAILSVAADNESSPELIEPQSDSPGESKGASSDEMVTSSDSEVAHSSWTLLEAVNQDEGQQSPPILQGFGQLQMQSWEENSSEQETSTVQVESSSVIIRETVQVHLSQQGATLSDFAPGQVFAQALADELQNRYSELMAELQRLREAASESQERTQGLEEEIRSLAAAKDEAESQAQRFEEELQSARSEMDTVAQHSGSELERQSMEMHLLEEQLASLQTEGHSKEQKIQALQADLDEAQHSLSEQEGQARMLSAQLEEWEITTSELEQKLQDMEARLLEFSQARDMAKAVLSERDTEINELLLRITQKEQEMMELSNGMSAKLLQTSEEKFLMSTEVKKLKEQIIELENAGEKEKATGESHVEDGDELTSLRKDKEDLTTQVATIKKRLQAALVQRKELMKKVAEFEKDADQRKGQVGKATEEAPASVPALEKDRKQEVMAIETTFEEFRQALKSKEEAMEVLEQKISQQDQVLEETLEMNRRLSEGAEQTPEADTSAEITGLQSQVASLESDCETLQKKLQEAQDSCKDTICKAKEKDRHHREQLKQQKEEYNGLLERLEEQVGERDGLLTRLSELEELQAQKEVGTEKEVHAELETNAAVEKIEKPASGDWVQEDWVEFAAPENEAQQQQGDNPITSAEEPSQLLSADIEALLQALKEEVQAEKASCTELEGQLQESQASLSLRESELLVLGKELQALREKESQIEHVYEELEALREKCLQAQTYAEAVKAELEAAAKGAASDSAESTIAILQTEVGEFKQFLSNKNDEIMELSQQLGEQSSLLQSMQETVYEKDQSIASLQEGLRAEKEKSQRLEAEVPQRQEEEKGSNSKILQLQQKLKAALISRKEALKENKSQKEQLASTEKVITELHQKMEAREVELEKLRAERERLIEEVDRTLVENQSLEGSCESLKLAMEGMLTEKDFCKREAESAKEEAARACREWEEKLNGMKDEYETLLKSYENVSDEAERVRRVLEAARQERKELVARARTHETARQEAERQKEEAQKEVDTVKDKMRKFAKTKQQKIMDLEEENESLREMDEKKGIRREDNALKGELERLKDEFEALKADLNATTAQRDSLEQQVVELREQLAQELEKGDRLAPDKTPSSDDVVEETIVAQQSSTVMTKTTQEPVKSQPQDIEPHSQAIESEVAAPETPSVEEMVKIEITEHTQALIDEKLSKMEATLQSERELRQQREAELTAELASLEQRLQESKEKQQTQREEPVKTDMSESEQTVIEGKRMEMEAALHSEREQWQESEAELKVGLASLEQLLQESKDKEQSLMEESSKREAQLQELHSSLEVEKDDLEERLMNQLAQLNGSIAGYQQDATDSRERLAELQREVERLERERAELEALAESERDRAARLEEDKRQAQRERAEAEAESGKQRELEQQLKSAQRVKEGSQSRAKQLEELLREKQLEVRQMQKDCIQYQERISEMAREGKALQLGSNEVHKELGQACLERTKVTDALKKTEAELSSCKAQLVEAQTEASQAQAERRACEQTTLQREAELKAEAEQSLDSVRFRLGAELKHIELRLEESYREREREEDATREAKELADTAERQAQQMQTRLDESLARLAAFSRCMSSLQDDRDRVLDETRQWESRFNSTLQGKEAEVREGETRSRDLAEQLQKETARREELQLTVDRLQKADEQWQLKWEQEEKRLRENQAALEQEREELQKSLAQTETSLADARAKLASLESEAEGLRHRTQALEEAVGKLQGETNEARSQLKEREAEGRRLGLSVEQLETDLRSSKTLTESLQTELSEKERREVELLGEKEQAVTQAAEESRREADSRAQEAEKELEERREEVRGLEDRLRKAEEESSHSKARLDAFTKAMGSLQDDRDRVLGMYKQLEEKHLQVMMEKDALIQEAAAENNSLKEELRSLLVQRDDLHAEKAKLSAQLHGYRDDLTQVLTMKESQHKQLLSGQLERIATLEKEKEELGAKIKSLEGGEALVQAVERETLSQAGDSGNMQVRDAPGAEVEKLREQLQAARTQVESLEESLAKEREVQEARQKELKELRWEGGVTRTESETAAERVAELARDLLTMEQRLLEEREVAGQLRAQNQAFGKAMASLQGSRDQALSQAQELSLRLEEMSRAGGQQTPTMCHGGSTAEVWGLKNALSALQNDRERLLEQLQRQHSELTRLGGGELSRLSQELEEERRRAEEMVDRMRELDNLRQRENQELEILRLEQVDWQAQAEVLKQQTLVTLSDRDQQVRQLGAMLEEARATRPKPPEEHHQRQAPVEADLSSKVGVLQSESGPLNELQLREQRITQLSNKLSQVFEENRHLSSQFQGSSQRLDEAESRCTALQRQLQELHEDKRKGTGEVDSAPGAPQQHSGPSESESLRVDFKELQRRLDEEQQYRVAVEEQLMAAQDRLKLINQGEWQSAHEGQFSASETAVLIEPPGGSVTRIRSSSGPGLMRMLRVAFCSRQRTPLLVSLYLLTVHVLLLLCLGGYV
ncbi:golgin subfamily B member 1 isoform X3 [Salmo salar]|uniref:Golgin subfamily B member 1 isoform X3 n=1 Tax=Salmo salar TaxID=8030 RepID=A0ABM3DAR2_SALSA|nr:golgin subfamily B member 1 isoform X3 [Salmo salar]|eukprot:XP_014008948.1 PREDICTED: golgin subfamily B member 1-like isoform X2 [Salmo salar]